MMVRASIVRSCEPCTGLAGRIIGTGDTPGVFVGKRLTFIGVVVALSVACTPPPVQRPLEGAQPVSETPGTNGSVAALTPVLSIPPTLSASNPSLAGSPGAGSSPSPLPAPSPSPEAGYTIVATDGRGANLREGPSTTARVITTLAEGTSVAVYGDLVPGDGGTTWRRIHGAGRDGWVVAPVVRRR